MLTMLSMEGGIHEYFDGRLGVSNVKITEWDQFEEYDPGDMVYANQRNRQRRIIHRCR